MMLTGNTKIRLSQIKLLATDKTDANGMNHSDSNGQFVSKNNNSTKEIKYEYASKIPLKEKQKLRKNLSNKLNDVVKKGIIYNKTIGDTKISAHSVGKLGSDKALDKSMKNGFTPEEHFDAAGKIVKLYEQAELKRTDPDKHGDPNIKSIKRFNQEFETCKGKPARAWITIKESTQHGHRLYSVEVMEIETAGTSPAVESGAGKIQTDATCCNIAYNQKNSKSLKKLFEELKAQKRLSV